MSVSHIFQSSLSFERDEYLASDLVPLTDAIVTDLLIPHILNKYGWIVTREDWRIANDRVTLIYEQQRSRYNHFMHHACAVCDHANCFEAHFILNKNDVIRTFMRCTFCNYMNIYKTVKYASHFKHLFGHMAVPISQREAYRRARKEKQRMEEDERAEIQHKLAFPMFIHQIAGVCEGH